MKRIPATLIGLTAALVATFSVTACGDDNEGDGGSGGSGIGGNGAGGVTATSTSTGTSSGTDTGTSTGTGGCDVPTTTAELEAYLSSGAYQAWNAEAAPHDSAGPHFGDVRVFMNDVLFDSLTAGNASHPACSAVIKELYGNGATVGGYSVMVKVADGTTGSDWYWYEDYQGSTYADGVGVSLCTGCHDDGQDFVLSDFPL